MLTARRLLVGGNSPLLAWLRSPFYAAISPFCYFVDSKTSVFFLPFPPSMAYPIIFRRVDCWRRKNCVQFNLGLLVFKISRKSIVSTTLRKTSPLVTNSAQLVFVIRLQHRDLNNARSLFFLFSHGLCFNPVQQTYAVNRIFISIYLNIRLLFQSTHLARFVLHDISSLLRPFGKNLYAIKND